MTGKHWNLDNQKQLFWTSIVLPDTTTVHANGSLRFQSRVSYHLLSRGNILVYQGKIINADSVKAFECSVWDSSCIVQLPFKTPLALSSCSLSSLLVQLCQTVFLCQIWPQKIDICSLLMSVFRDIVSFSLPLDKISIKAFSFLTNHAVWEKCEMSQFRVCFHLV